ncbi:MAG: HD domain-containing protein [Gemmatimonadales bacterium]
MYSDRIHHALAFATKHHPERVSRHDGHSCLIRSSSVAIILARHGVDEHTIVASILKQLVDACPYAGQASLAERLTAKFGSLVTDVVWAAAEPRFDVIGRERTWKATRFEHLTRLAVGPPAAVDVCVAEELHRIGSALVSIRRLGVEYLEAVGVPTPADTLWWLDAFGDAVTGHSRWQRPALLAEFTRLSQELGARLREGSG